MDAELTALFAVMTVMAMNQAILRTPALLHHPFAFSGMQLTNALAGLMVMTRGLPGVEYRGVSLAIGLLFWYHGVENLRFRTEAQREVDNELKEQERAIAEAFRQSRPESEDIER